MVKFRSIQNFVECATGFRSLNQSQILEDVLFYQDTLDSQQWLVYFISKPLIGSYDAIRPAPVPISGLSEDTTRGGTPLLKSPAKPSSSTGKKDVKSFSELLNQFPLIARQMHLGLEKVFKDFHRETREWQPSVRSRRSSNTPEIPLRSASAGSAGSRSNGSIHSKNSNGRPKSPFLWMPEDHEEENNLRSTLETAVTAAIDLFQQVDKQQLSVLGATTDLTGPAVERLIERYVTEQVHDSVLFPFLRKSRTIEDHELESRIRVMQYIDIAQVGIEIDGGRAGKVQIMDRIARGVVVFRQLRVAGSPQQMTDTLLST